MALVTTIGGTSSDSYVTVAEYGARADALFWEVGFTANMEHDLRRAAVALEATYSWVGTKQYQFQALGWPRLVHQLVDGWPINPDAVPQAVKDAQMELAHLIYLGAEPLATFDGAVKREKVDVIEVEYIGGKARPRFTAVDRILRDYITSGPGQIRAVRA